MLFATSPLASADQKHCILGSRFLLLQRLLRKAYVGSRQQLKITDTKEKCTPTNVKAPLEEFILSRLLSRTCDLLFSFRVWYFGQCKSTAPLRSRAYSYLLGLDFIRDRIEVWVVMKSAWNRKSAFACYSVNFELLKTPIKSLLALLLLLHKERFLFTFLLGTRFQKLLTRRSPTSFPGLSPNLPYGVCVRKRDWERENLFGSGPESGYYK